MNTTNYLLADNQDLSCLGFMYLIEQQNKQQKIVCVKTKAELRGQLQAQPESLVIFDFFSFDWDTVEEISLISKAFPASKWLCIIEVVDEKFTHQLIKLLPEVNIELKTASKEELLAAINASTQGKKYYCSEALEILLGNKKQRTEDKRITQLTTTEREIVQLLAQGKTTKDIANERHLSYHTVITHRKNIFRKLEINTVHELTKYALKNGLVDLTEYYI
jgi:DNA-binding NarL/FixJ family response regulator